MSEEFTDAEVQQIITLGERYHKRFVNTIVKDKMEPQVVLEGGLLGVALFIQGFDGMTEEQAVESFRGSFQQAKSMAEQGGEVSDDDE